MPTQTPTPADLPRLSPRARDTNKRDYGRVIVVGGTAGMAGAPALTGMAALRGGAGLVTVLVPQSVVPITASFDPCLMVSGLSSAHDGGFSEEAALEVRERLLDATAVAVGPGLGRSDAVTVIVRDLWRDLHQPAVFDADALWCLAHLDEDELASHAGPRILTPHAGEMLRLIHDDPASPRFHDRTFLETKAAEMADAIDAVVVLKGPATLVVDRRRRAHNENGNPGMAKAGTGDVLTGVITALLAQQLSSFDAARLGTWIHGLAGDIAAADLGEISMTARDLLDRLPTASRAAIK